MGRTQPGPIWQSSSGSVLGRKGLADLSSLPALRPNAGTRTFSPARGFAEGFVGHISPKQASAYFFDGEPRGGRVPGLSVSLASSLSSQYKYFTNVMKETRLIGIIL